jgi:hypothetical protein
VHLPPRPGWEGKILTGKGKKNCSGGPISFVVTTKPQKRRAKLNQTKQISCVFPFHITAPAGSSADAFGIEWWSTQPFLCRWAIWWRPTPKTKLGRKRERRVPFSDDKKGEACVWFPVSYYLISINQSLSLLPFCRKDVLSPATLALLQSKHAWQKISPRDPPYNGFLAQDVHGALLLDP